MSPKKKQAARKKSGMAKRQGAAKKQSPQRSSDSPTPPVSGSKPRAKFIEVALREIQEIGAHAMTLRSVSRKAGCSPMAVYRHFQSKEDLIAHISLEGFVALRAEIDEAVKLHPGDPVQQLAEVGRRYVKLAIRNSGHLLMMFGGFVRDHSGHPELQEAGHRAFDGLLQVVRAGQHQGVFQQGDPVALALAAWTQVHGFSMLLINGHLRFLGLEVEKHEQMLSPIGLIMMTGMLKEKQS